MKLWEKLAILGGVAATGGLLAPLAAPAAAGAIAGGTGIGSAALGGTALGSATTLASGAGTAIGASPLAGLGGLLGSAGTTAMGGLEGVSKIAPAVYMAKGLMQEQPLQSSPISQGDPSGGQYVSQMYEQGQQAVQNQLDQAAQERMKRRQWG